MVVVAVGCSRPGGREWGVGGRAPHARRGREGSGEREREMRGFGFVRECIYRISILRVLEFRNSITIWTPQYLNFHILHLS